MSYPTLKIIYYYFFYLPCKNNIILRELNEPNLRLFFTEGNKYFLLPLVDFKVIISKWKRIVQQVIP